MVSESVITSVTAPAINSWPQVLGSADCWRGACLVLGLPCPDLSVDWVIGLVIPVRLLAQHHC